MKLGTTGKKVKHSLNNPSFNDYLHLFYPNELEIKETTDTPSSALYLYPNLYIDNTECLKADLYDKRVDFTFPIVNFPFLIGTIPTSPADLGIHFTVDPLLSSL